MIARKQREDIILATLARRHNVAQIRRIGAVVGSTGRLLIGIRRREVVRQLAGAVVVVTRIVRAVLDLSVDKKCY